MDSTGGSVLSHFQRVANGDVVAVVSTFNDFRGGGLGEVVNRATLRRFGPVCVALVVKSVGTVCVVAAERAGAVHFRAMAEFPAMDVEACGRVVGYPKGSDGGGSDGCVTRPKKRNDVSYFFYF